MNVTEIGYGMGTKDFAAANCVRVFLGESSPGSNTAPSFDDSVLSISCNLDDMTGEAVGFATELLLQAGAFGRIHNTDSDEKEPSGYSFNLYL